MKHAVFISHSHADTPTADAVCTALEACGVRCWLALRDIPPGAEWASAIAEAITASRVLILIHSKSANESPQVVREVERAVHYGLRIVPLRIEQVPLSKSLEYFVSSCHWVDAMTPPLAVHLQRLAGRVLELLSDQPTLAAETPVVRVACGKAYRLGTRLAQVSWHHGDGLRRQTLQEELIRFAASLSLPQDVIETTLSEFISVSDPGGLVQNARSGIEASNGIACLIERSIGGRPAAAFRLGFRIADTVSLLKFLSMGRQAAIPFQQLADSVESQMARIADDAVLVGIPAHFVDILESIRSDAKEPEGALTILMRIASALDRGLNDD